MPLGSGGTTSPSRRKRNAATSNSNGPKTRVGEEVCAWCQSPVRTPGSRSADANMCVPLMRGHENEVATGEGQM